MTVFIDLDLPPLDSAAHREVHAIIERAVQLPDDETLLRLSEYAAVGYSFKPSKQKPGELKQSALGASVSRQYTVPVLLWATDWSNLVVFVL